MLAWLRHPLYVPTASTESPQLCLWQTSCSSFLSGLGPSNQHSHMHTDSLLLACVLYLCPHELESSIKKPICNESIDYSKLFLFMASPRLLVLWALNLWLNYFSAMTRCCLLPPVINGGGPPWLCSRKDKRCPVTFTLGTCGHAIKWKIRMFLKAKVYSQLYIFRSLNACGVF